MVLWQARWRPSIGLSQRCGQADNEGDLKRVQLNTTTESQIVTQAIRSVLEDAPIHLLSYLLDYFLLQVQSNDMMYRAPCHASPKLDLAWRTGNTYPASEPVRLGCGDMHQFVVWTETHHVFGVTSEY